MNELAVLALVVFLIYRECSAAREHERERVERPKRPRPRNLISDDDAQVAATRKRAGDEGDDDGDGD